MRYARASLLLAAAIISPTLAACADADTDAATPAPESTSKSASSSAVETPSTAPSSSGSGSATVDDYASLVAQYATRLQAEIRDGLDPEQCSWGLGPPDMDSTGHCRESAATIQRGARKLAARLTQAQDDSELGAPPDQITTLVKDTIAVAQATDRQAGPALRCAQDYTLGCDPKANRWNAAMHDMRDQLAAWSKYL